MSHTVQISRRIHVQMILRKIFENTKLFTMLKKKRNKNVDSTSIAQARISSTLRYAEYTAEEKGGKLRLTHTLSFFFSSHFNDFSNVKHYGKNNIKRNIVQTDATRAHTHTDVTFPCAMVIIDCPSGRMRTHPQNSQMTPKIKKK